MSPTLRLVLPGLALIAVSYGLARFAYGLFLPEMRAEVGLTPTLAGAIGGGAYASYCVTVVAGALLAERFGPRAVAVAAAAIAAAGLALIAASSTAAALAAAVLFAGVSTGLASPPMADAVARVVPPDRQPRANSAINSGTSIGVVLSGPVALAAAGQWREAYALFAAVAAATALWVAVAMPGGRPEPEPGRGSRERPRPDPAEPGGLLRREAAALVLAAGGTGFASASYWTFAAEVVVDVGGLSRGLSGLAWVAIGVAGLAGAAAGDLIGRFGMNATHRGFLLGLAGAALTLVAFPGQPAAVLASSALFGAAYITLSGIYIVWGVRLYADRPAVGLALPFLTIALGQVAGAPLAGAMIGAAGYTATFVAFAGVAAATMLCPYRTPGSAPRQRCPASSMAGR